MPTPYQPPTRLDLIVSAQLLLPRHDETSSKNRDDEINMYRALNTDVAVVKEFLIERRRIDALFSEGGGVNVLSEYAKEFCTFR